MQRESRQALLLPGGHTQTDRPSSPPPPRPAPAAPRAVRRARPGAATFLSAGSSAPYPPPASSPTVRARTVTEAPTHTEVPSPSLPRRPAAGLPVPPTAPPPQPVPSNRSSGGGASCGSPAPVPSPLCAAHGPRQPRIMYGPERRSPPLRACAMQPPPQPPQRGGGTRLAPPLPPPHTHTPRVAPRGRNAGPGLPPQGSGEENPLRPHRHHRGDLPPTSGVSSVGGGSRRGPWAGSLMATVSLPPHFQPALKNGDTRCRVICPVEGIDVTKKK